MGKKISELDSISSVTDNGSVLPIVDNGATKKIAVGSLSNVISSILGFGTASKKDTGTTEGTIPVLSANGKLDSGTLPDSDSITEGTSHLFVTNDEKTKIDGVESGSQVNVIESVSGTSPVTASTSSKAVTVGIQAASASQDGYLNKADYATIHGLGTASTKDVGISSGNVPVLGTDGKLNSAVIPQIALMDSNVVASEAAMLALTCQKGDIAIRTDVNKSYILSDSDPSVLSNWQEMLTPTDAVQSVNGLTGTVVLGADNVDEGASHLYMTSAERTKLSAIEAGAEVNVVDSVNDKTGAVVLTSDDVSEGSNNKYMTSNEKTKLAGVASGATVNNLTLNGTSNNSPSIYAPTTYGTDGAILVAKGQGQAPQWVATSSGSITGVTGNAPLTSTSASGIVTISLPAASESSDGYMSSSDKAALDNINTKYASRKSVTETTLTASNWTGTTSPYLYTLTVSCTATQEVDVYPATGESVELHKSVSASKISAYSQSENTIVLQAINKPTVDIPIVIEIGSEPLA
jgi:hypothetical protein